jgi:hypothetical protein
VLTSTLTAEVKSLQNQAEEVTTGPRVPFGLCETPGVAPEDNIPPAAAAKLKDLPADQAAPAKAAIRAQIQAACDQNVQGFEAAYLLTFYVGLAAIVFGFFLPGWPGKWEGRSEMQKKASVGH